LILISWSIIEKLIFSVPIYTSIALLLVSYFEKVRILFVIVDTNFNQQTFEYLKKFAMTTKENILKTLKSNKLKLSKLGIRNVGLFGSYLHNEQSIESDIDLLIDFEPEKENFDNYMAVYDLLENLFKNEKVEVVTKNDLSPYIGSKILNEVHYVLRLSRTPYPKKFQELILQTKSVKKSLLLIVFMNFINL
jgi:predicted nucleotidyltransferase